MKYYFCAVIGLILLSSCRKHNNPSRGALLGNYHFVYDSTTLYNGTIKISNPDDGNSVIITYPQGGNTVFSTSDSSLYSYSTNCPMGQPGILGNYRHDTLYIYDYYDCGSQFGRTIYTFAVKY